MESSRFAPMSTKRCLPGAAGDGGAAVVGSGPGDGVAEASSMLLTLEQSMRAGRARWRERLLSHHERLLLEHPEFDSLLMKIEEGLMSFEDAYAQLRDGNE